MSMSEKDSANSEESIIPCSGQNNASSESDCKFAWARNSSKTLSLRKVIRSEKFGKTDISEIFKVKPGSKCRHIGIPDNRTAYCESEGLEKGLSSTERVNFISSNTSISETVDPQKYASDSVDFFIDGQNLFHSIKNLYRYKHLNVDVVELCKAVAKRMDRKLGKIRFYTGISSPNTSPHWYEYWSNRLKRLRMDGVECFSTELRYIDGRGTEKGIDVMIALDILERASSGPGMIIILSQDNDLAVAASRALEKARERQYKIEVASAFPVLDLEPRRGIEGTTEIRMNRLFYDQHLEKEDSRSEHMRKDHESELRKKQNVALRGNNSTLH